MEIIVISVVAFLVSILTFFSGFGLGTILTPVLMIFSGRDCCCLDRCGTFFNNVFKLFLVGKNANKSVLLRFGIPAVIAAFAGAWVLIHIPDVKPLLTYSLFDKKFEVFPVKFLISILLIIFAIMDLITYFTKLKFGKEKLPLGGALSGFFGGLSGNQGALRTAFLIKAGLSKETLVVSSTESDPYFYRIQLKKMK